MIRLKPSTADPLMVDQVSHNVAVEYQRIMQSAEQFAEPFREGDALALNPLVRALIRALTTEFRLQLASATILIDSNANEAEMLSNIELAVLERTVLMCGTEIDRRKDAERG